MERGGRWATTAVTWTLTLVLIAPHDFDFTGTGMQSAGDVTTRAAWLSVLGISTGLLAWRSGRALMLLRYVNPYLLLALLLAAASITWSIAPSFTILRVVRFLTVIEACLCVALVGWEPQRFQSLLRSIMLFVCAASIAFAVFFPEGGIHHELAPELHNAWKGVTMGKNILGSLSGVCIVVWLHGWVSRQVKPILGMLGVGAGVACLIGSRSQTSIMAAVFAAMFLLLLLRPPGTMKRSMPYIVTAFAAAILIYALAVLRLVPGLESILEPIQMFTGKDLTFSGRTRIWQLLSDHIRLNPWLGSGYGAYWIGEDHPESPSYGMIAILYFYPTEGHNGYLDVINDLGAAGGVCLFAYFVRYIRDGLRLMRSDRAQSALYLTLIFRGFLADMSESHWFNALSFDFAIMTLATAALARSLLQIKLDKAAGLAPASPNSAARGGAARRYRLGARPVRARGPSQSRS